MRTLFPFILILAGLGLCAVTSVSGRDPLIFIPLVLALGCLGSGVVLLISNARYPQVSARGKEAR